MFNRKKGDSMMVSYVLLIVIAVAVSGLVYTYLKLYVPSENIECNEDISLTIDSVKCNLNASVLEVQLSNSGLFTVEQAFIRFAEENRTVRTQINKNDTSLPKAGGGLFLMPGERTPVMLFSVNSTLKAGITQYILEVQPAIFEKRRIVPCSNKIITQEVTCA